MGQLRVGELTRESIIDGAVKSVEATVERLGTYVAPDVPSEIVADLVVAGLIRAPKQGRW